MVIMHWSEDLIVTLLGWMEDLYVIRLLNRRSRDLWDGAYVYKVAITDYDSRLLRLSRAYAWTTGCLERGVVPRNSFGLESGALQNVIRRFITPETLGQDMAILIMILRDSQAVSLEAIEIASNIGDPRLEADALGYMARQIYLARFNAVWFDSTRSTRLWYRFRKECFGEVFKMYQIPEFQMMVELDMLLMLTHPGRDADVTLILDAHTDPQYPWVWDLRLAYYLLSPDVTISRDTPYLVRLFLAYLGCTTFSLPDTVSEYHQNPIFRDEDPATHRLVLDIISQDPFVAHRTKILYSTLLRHTGILSE